MTDEEKSKHSSLEHLKVLLPALSLVALIVAQLTDKHALTSKLLLGLTIFFVIVGYSPYIKARLTRWHDRTKDDAVAKGNCARFREFVRRFGGFIDGRMNDTLHATMQGDNFLNRSDHNPAFRIPNADLWQGWWLYYAQRIDRQNQVQRMSEFLPALMEFHSLVGSYNNHCVAPIFVNLPQAVREQIPATAKSSLNSFQQRYERFLGEYEQFARVLSESRPILEGLPHWFSAPKPL